MAERVYNVGNSARSILAEPLLRAETSGRFRSFSAGSHPKGTVNPMALKVLDRGGLLPNELHSKSWEAFAVGPGMDFVFTVCNQAAGDVPYGVAGR